MDPLTASVKSYSVDRGIKAKDMATRSKADRQQMHHKRPSIIHLSLLLLLLSMLLSCDGFVVVVVVVVVAVVAGAVTGNVVVTKGASERTHAGEAGGRKVGTKGCGRDEPVSS